MTTLKFNLDDVDWLILQELQEDARLSYSELGRRVSLSAPAVQERIRKLQESGVIKGYHVSIDLEKIGLPIKALIQMTGTCRNSHIFMEAAQDIPEILQCHHVLGEHCFYLIVAVASMKHLESLMQTLYDYGETVTTVILSSPVESRIINPDHLQ